jgi:hypothetical protein
MCLQQIRKVEAYLKAHCFTCRKPKRISGWLCSDCQRRQDSAVRKSKKGRK